MDLALFYYLPKYVKQIYFLRADYMKIFLQLIVSFGLVPKPSVLTLRFIFIETILIVLCIEHTPPGCLMRSMP